jgi:hypothetical protein
LEFLFVTYNYSDSSYWSLPTFATIDINWPDHALEPVTKYNVDGILCNFDLYNNDSIQLIRTKGNGHNNLHYTLKLKPIMCFIYVFNGDKDDIDCYYQNYLNYVRIYTRGMGYGDESEVDVFY